MKMDESELIDKFLRGELTEEENQDFLKEIEANAELKKKLSLRKIVMEAIGLAYADKLKNSLVEFDKLLNRKRRFEFSWKMAAVFAVFIVTVSIVYFNVKNTNPYDFDVAEPGLPNEMGISKNLEFTRAMNDYKAGDLKLAAPVLNYLLTQNPKNDTLLYFSGICEFRNHNTAEAIRNWNQINSQSVFSNKVEYRLAIAYWVDGEPEKTQELLKKIKANKNHPYQKEAIKALRTFD